MRNAQVHPVRAVQTMWATWDELRQGPIGDKAQQSRSRENLAQEATG